MLPETQEHDGLGRQIGTFVGYVEDPDDPLEEAKIFEQSATTYDGAGHVILTALLQRYHDDTASTGPLVDGENARPQYAAAGTTGSAARPPASATARGC